jgi:NAD(P)-dependent dehydrogenase (short-subunit alcohol dehydrogenase family)
MRTVDGPVATGGEDVPGAARAATPASGVGPVPLCASGAVSVPATAERPAAPGARSAARSASPVPPAEQVHAVRDLFSLRGRTAVVTGASSGLGARFATVLAAAGATVFAAARRADRLAELAAADSRIHPVPCDVSREQDRIRLAETALTATGRFDVLVNNAGVGGAPRAAEETSRDFADVLAVNLVAPFHLARLMAEAEAEAHGRSIVNVASILGLVSGAPLGGAGYAASKAGLVGLTRELAGQWGRAGVRVNALAPGWFRSEMTEELFADARSSRWVEKNTMLCRAGEGAELDGALLFLASDASSYCTGQVIVVDGGWTAR